MSKQTSTHTASVCSAVTPNDSADLPLGTCRAIYVGTTGDISIVDGAGSIVLFASVTGILPVQTARINDAGTTATNIVALY